MISLKWKSILRESRTAWESLSTICRQLKNTKNLPKFQPIVIKPDASQADIAFIESHRSDIPVLEMISVSRGDICRAAFLAHTAAMS